MAATDVDSVLRLEAEAPPDWAQAFADERALAQWKAAMAPHLHRDFEYLVPWGPGGTTTHRGLNAWTKVWVDVLEAFDRVERDNDPRHLLDLGDGRVLAYWESRATSKEGVEVDTSVWSIHTVRDDLIYRIEFFSSPDAAFEAAGVEPATAMGS